jgi:putative inorganic carbon (hco3(-)) transporter
MSQREPPRLSSIAYRPTPAVSSETGVEREFLTRYGAWGLLLLVPVCLIAGVAALFLRWEYFAALFIGWIGFGVVLANPFLGLIAYILTEYTRPGEVLPVLAILRPQRLLALLLIVSVLLRYRAVDRPRLAASPVNLAVLALFASVWLSVPGAYWKGGAFLAAIDFTKTILIYFVTTALLVKPERLRLFLWTFFAGTVFVALTMLRNKFAGGGTYVTEGVQRAGAVGAFLANPNDAAAALLAGLPLPFYLWSATKDWRARVALLGCLVLMLVALMSSGSRGGFLGLITIAAVYWWKSERKAATAAVLILGAALFWGFAPEDYRGRMDSILHHQTDASAQSRIEGWRIARAMFWRQPLTGVGPANFVPARAAWFATGNAFADWMDVHSLYYQTLSELGTLGSLSLLAFLFLVLRDHRRLQRSPCRIVGYPRAGETQCRVPASRRGVGRVPASRREAGHSEAAKKGAEAAEKGAEPAKKGAAAGRAGLGQEVRPPSGAARGARHAAQEERSDDLWFYHASCGLETAFLALMVAGTFTHLLYYPFLYTIAALTTSMRRATEGTERAVPPPPDEPAGVRAALWNARYASKQAGSRV